MNHSTLLDPPTLLVVDDMPEVCELVSAILEEEGYRVLTANGAEEAVEIARETPDLQLLITDVEMPEVGGEELAEWFGISRPDVKVLFMSANPAFRRELDGAPFIDKPFRPLALLLKTVHDLLTQSRAHDRAVTLAA